MAKVKKDINYEASPIPGKPGPKIISYDRLKKAVGGAASSEGKGAFAGEVKCGSNVK